MTRSRLVTVLATTAAALLTAVLAGCQPGTVAGVAAGTDQVNSSPATTTPGTDRVFDPRTDDFPLSESELTFAGEDAKKTFDAIRTGAQQVADERSLLHVERSYGGGNYIREKWCTAKANEPDRCWTNQSVDGEPRITIEHLLYTYDFDWTTPKHVEYQSVSVTALTGDEDGWSLTANVSFDEQDAGVLHATVSEGGLQGERENAVSIGEDLQLQLQVYDGAREITGGTVTLEATDDLATQLQQFTSDAATMRTNQLRVLEDLQQAVNGRIADRQIEVCEREQALRGDRALAMPQPPCDPTELTDADVAALQQYADDWFSGQRSLLRAHTDELFSALTSAYPWQVLG